MGPASKALRAFTTRDLVLIAIVAALGIAIKPVVVPIAHLVSAPLLIPAGALAGGIYMMWLVVGMGLVGKRGTATLIALVQALIVMLTGVVGSHGAMSLVSYTAPGIVVDLGFLLIGHTACCLSCCFLAGVLANMTGTLMVSIIFFRLPPIPLALTMCTAALSGGVGGIIAWEVIRALRRYRIGAPGGGPPQGGSRGRRRAARGRDAESTRGSPASGRASSACSAVSLLVLVTACSAALTGCSGSGSAVAGTAPSSSGATIPLTNGASGSDRALVVADAFAAVSGEGDEMPLSDALRATGHRGARRVAVYEAGGRITEVPLAACAVTSAGRLLVGGRDAGRPAGIVVDPPAASVRDVRALAEESLAAGERSLVVYLDGFGYEQYITAREQDDIPRLAELSSRKATTVYPTITPVTFAAMVTGEDPATTGVRDRSTHALSCSSIFDWAEARGLTTALVEGDLQILALTESTTLNVDEDGDGSTDDEVFAAARRQIRTSHPDFMLVHFHGIDDASHQDGPFARTTRLRVRELDAMAGELIDAWDGRVIVVADHGQHTVDHPAEGEGHGEHGAFRSADLFVPLLVREAR